MGKEIEDKPVNIVSHKITHLPRVIMRHAGIKGEIGLEFKTYGKKFNDNMIKYANFYEALEKFINNYCEGEENE